MFHRKSQKNGKVITKVNFAGWKPRIASSSLLIYLPEFAPISFCIFSLEKLDTCYARAWFNHYKADIVRHIERRYHFVKLERAISSWTLSETVIYVYSSKFVYRMTNYEETNSQSVILTSHVYLNSAYSKWVEIY